MVCDVERSSIQVLAYAISRVGAILPSSPLSAVHGVGTLTGHKNREKIAVV